MCLSVSTLHSSVIMKNQFIIDTIFWLLFGCLFVPGPKQEVGTITSVYSFLFLFCVY